MYLIKLRNEEQNDLYPILFSVLNHQQDPNYQGQHGVVCEVLSYKAGSYVYCCTKLVANLRTKINADLPSIVRGDNIPG